MKRGRKGSPVEELLFDLLKLKCPSGLYPWMVNCVGKVYYCYAKTKVDAIRKVSHKICIVEPVPVQEIIKAARSPASADV